MDSSTQETLYSDPKWFFKHQKEDILHRINLQVRYIMLQNKDFFNQVEMDDELLKQFLCANKDVMKMVETPTFGGLKPKSFLLPSFIVTCIDRFVKECSYHDWDTCTANLETQPPVQQQQPISDIAISQPIQHQSDSMNLDDSQGDTNKTSSKSSDNIKPSEQSTITSDKKRKQEHLADNFNNSNLILTGYCPQQEEQAQLLDLIVYDIPAKWDSYTLLARVRLIPNHECLKAYNEGEWTVGLGGILVRWFSALWNLSEHKQREKFQAVITDIPADMTESTLFPNCTSSKFIAESGMKSFKVIKESSGQRKLIGYFATWDQASKCISTPQF
ncbi:hypothetical protein RclHR1_01800029 [Rhizophagus clarus]|uniref:Uncharacterized protein n=1 Tax=Rhizophagus clarus TaxID=94130 RepID=A0A2Z6R020_9GLOM|nr:hypothetical protein RclHR1_01800029 [Rhizophagus clarus]